LRPVDHADGAFEQRPGERVAYRLSAQRQDEVTESRFVEERFDTIRQRAANDLALRRLVPIGRCGNFAGVRGEAKQKGSIGVTLAHELTQVELAGAPHLRRARVAKMGVVGPDDDLRIRSEMIKQPVQRLCHVPVAQVPGAHASTKHRAVIALRVSNDLGILTRREELVAELTARFDRGTSAAHFEQLFDYTLLAALSQLKSRRVTVRLRVFAELVEAAIPEACSCSRLRVRAIEKPQHLLGGAVQAVQIETEEADRS